MIIKISGSSGYLGTIISNELIENGHRAEGISRELLYGPVEQLANELKNADAVIHLAGAPILQRWTDENKKEIIDSRVVTAQNLASAIKRLDIKHRPRKVVSASGISIFAPGKTHTEKSTDYAKGFLGEVGKQWEKVWELLPGDVELTIFRMAAVLGKKSHAIKKMNLPFKMGVGGKVGSGKQPFPFIHETDVARAYTWAIEKPQINGIYILAAPNQVSNTEFTKAMAKTLNRPAVTTVPAFALKLIYGQAATLLIKSPAVHPEKLLNEGFQFKYENIEQTLKQIYH